MKKRYVFNAVGMDRFNRRPHTPPDGTVVIKVQPPGCPRNGTMGHCYVAHADSGVFIGLVLLNSLTEVDRG